MFSGSGEPDFGFSLSSNTVESGEGQPKVNIDTVIQAKMPVLGDVKGSEIALKNFFAYSAKLAEEFPSIKFNFLFGFKTSELINPDTRPSVDALIENQEVAPVYKKDCALNIPEELIFEIFRSVDVVFAKCN
jgi:hypothetical protein